MTTSGALCLCLLALSLAGCHATSSARTTHVGKRPLPAELEDDYAAFAENCSKCHQLARALSAPVRSPEHWDLYVARMMRNAGSAISPREAPAILRFLHWYTPSADATGVPAAEKPQ